MTADKTIPVALYAAVHYWLKQNYGKASKCESADCLGISKNYQWAKIRDKKYEKKRENFINLCVSCHQKYDFTEEERQNSIKNSFHRNKKHCKNGHELTKDNVQVYNGVRHCRGCKLIRLKNYRMTNRKMAREYLREWRKKKKLLSLLT